MNTLKNSTWTSLAAAVAFSCLAAQGREGMAHRPERPEQFDAPRPRARLVEASAFIRVTQARTTYSVTGAGLTAAVLDTGLRTTHVDFAGRVIAQRNFTSDNGGSTTNANDGDGHGTNVGGIICANADHIGMAPGARIIPVKVLDNNGSGSFAGIESGLQWVIDNRTTYNITVVNLSLGDSSNATSIGTDSFRTKVQTLRNAKVAVCIAAGNDFYENSSHQGMGYPAIIPESVSVGAVFDANIGQISYSGPIAYTTAAGRITPFSQRLHPNVGGIYRTDIFAPGAPITSSGINTDHGESTDHGTSQATPVTAGVIMLMQELYLRQNGTLPTVDFLENTLRSAGVTINDGDDEDDNVTNTGLDFIRIDALNALQAIAGGTPPPPPPGTPPSITAQPVSQTVASGQTATFSVSASGTATLSYQWQKNGSNVSGATGTSYTTPAVSSSDNGALFRCVVNNSYGTATSNSATLTVASSGPIALSNGVPVSASVALNEFKHYYIAVPAGATSLKVTTTNTSSDVDLYVRFGSAPTLSAYDFRPYLSSGNETVTVDGTTSPALSTGNWYCSVQGYTAGPFTLTATYTISTPNNPPYLLSNATATPNPATVGQSVSFQVAAADPDGNLLTYLWNFGDGATGSGSSSSHAYTVAGIYSASVSISDGKSSISDSVSVQVTGSGGGGGSLDLAYVQLGINFRYWNRDSIKAQGYLTLPAGFSVYGAHVTLDVGGAKINFTLNQYGKGSSPYGALRLVNNGGNGTFTTSLIYGNWGANWVDEGMINATVYAQPITMPVTLTVNGTDYSGSINLSYTATAWYSGKAR